MIGAKIIQTKLLSGSQQLEIEINNELEEVGRLVNQRIFVNDAQVDVPHQKCLHYKKCQYLE